jgi:membrane protein
MTQARKNGPSPQVDEERAPEHPTDLRGSSRRAVLKRTAREFREDHLTDWAAALTS